MAEPTSRSDHYRYAIGIGSNRGDREGAIAAAAVALTSSGDCLLLERSTLHTTRAVGGPPGQQDFLNGVWLLATSLGAHQLLHRLQGIETQLGRVRTVHWGPRTIDLDLLLRDDGLEICTPVLTLPHPRLHQRAFVLAPARELVGHWSIRDPQHPARRITIESLAQKVASQDGCPH